MKVADIMSRDPLYVEKTDFATRARQLIRDNHVRGLPVLDSEGRVIGIVTNQDMLKITSTRSNVTVAGFTVSVPLITEDMDMMEAARVMLQEKVTLLPVVDSPANRMLRGVVSLLDVFRNLDLSRVPDMPVDAIMSRDVITARPDDPISKVWDRMLEEDITGLPVVNESGRPIGVITRFDILKRGWARLGKEDMYRSKDTAKIRVEKLMSTPLYSIKRDAPLKQAIEVMRKHDIGRISVVENDVLVGIVDRYDLIKAVLGDV